MDVPFRSSRSPSPSHQDRKFAEAGCAPMLAPEALRRPLGARDQYSAPGLDARTFAATPRPLSPFGLVWNRIWPLEPLRCEDGWLPLSWTMKTSWPGRLGTKSLTCSASPWPNRVFHSACPLEPTAMAPYTTSWLPS